MRADLCKHCGARREDHKGGSDENGPEGRCPPVIAWGRPVPMKFPKKDDKVDAYLALFWSVRLDVFQPYA